MDRSVVVIPFVNLSPKQEDEFFCDGISEEIINALAQIPDLRVISRSSSFYYKNHHLTLQEIGEALSVSCAVEGSVRIVEDTIRISAQISQVENGTLLWSSTWDRKKEKLLTIQDEISLLIADNLRENLGHFDISQHLHQHATQNLSAYEHYLKGRHLFNHWNPEDVATSIENYELAVNIDPNLIDAWVGLADAYSFMAVAGFSPREQAWKKAQDCLNRAKKIDINHHALTHLLANEAFFTESNYSKARQLALRAISSKPTFADAHHFCFCYMPSVCNLMKPKNT